MTRQEAIKELKGRIKMQRDMSIYPESHKTRELELLEICLQALETLEKGE